MTIKDIINKYKNYAHIYLKGIEEHPTAAGNEYMQGYANAIKQICADLEQITGGSAKNVDYLAGLAARILNTDFYGIRDAMDAGPASSEDIIKAISEDLKDIKKCQSIVEYLLNYIEEVKA